MLGSMFGRVVGSMLPVVALLLAIFKHVAGCCEGVQTCGLTMWCWCWCWCYDCYLIDTELFTCWFVGVVAMGKLTFS